MGKWGWASGSYSFFLQYYTIIFTCTYACSTLSVGTKNGCYFLWVDLAAGFQVHGPCLIIYMCLYELPNHTSSSTMSTSTPVTPPTRGLVLPCPTSPSKASFSYKMTLGSEVSDDTLKLCANLFSSNYGIWGDQAAIISKFTVAGQWLRCWSLAIAESFTQGKMSRWPVQDYDPNVCLTRRVVF